MLRYDATAGLTATLRTTESHNQVKVVAVFEWRLDNHHAARGAHGVRIGPNCAINVCEHRRSADCTLLETPPAILILRVRSHANKTTEEIVQCNTHLVQCNYALVGQTVQAAKAAKELVPCDYDISGLSDCGRGLAPVVRPAAHFRAYVQLRRMTVSVTGVRPEKPIVLAAAAIISMTRPRTNGPRSLMRTTTERPVRWFVTRTRIPNGSERCAAVIPRA
jgi:hypothetical protein